MEKCSIALYDRERQLSRVTRRRAFYEARRAKRHTTRQKHIQKLLLTFLRCPDCGVVLVMGAYHTVLVGAVGRPMRRRGLLRDSPGTTCECHTGAKLSSKTDKQFATRLQVRCTVDLAGLERQSKCCRLFLALICGTVWVQVDLSLERWHLARLFAMRLRKHHP